MRSLFQDTAIFDLILHPRLPPITRRFPPVSVLSLYRAEESNTESHAREQLGLGVSVINGTNDDRMEVDTETYRANRIISSPVDKDPFQPTSLAAPLPLSAPFMPPEALPHSTLRREPSLESSARTSAQPAQFPAPIEPTSAELLTESGLVSSAQLTALTTPVQPLASLAPSPTTNPTLAQNQVNETSTWRRVVQVREEGDKERAEDDDEDTIPAINMESDSDERQSP
jgi:hypothetical protein